MNNLKIFASAALLAASFTAPALADNTADWQACQTYSHQLNSAMNKAGGVVARATAEQRMGMQACTNGLYKNGAEHYRKALDILGADQAAAASASGGSKTLVDPAQ